jgi:hypothetical protein
MQLARSTKALSGSTSTPTTTCSTPFAVGPNKAQTRGEVGFGALAAMPDLVENSLCYGDG